MKCILPGTIRQACLSAVLLSLAIVGSEWACAGRLDLTGNLEYLGNPYLERYPAETDIYARNIWDMISFEDKIFLGAGNSSNFGPAPNAGPVPVISYDPDTGSFTSECILDEEQIDAFYEFEGILYIPGHDPKEDWTSGNFYTFSSEGWQKNRNIPYAIHTYGLAFFDNKLFAALGARKGMSVAVSEDNGLSWQQYNTGNDRIYDFIKVKERLYAAGVFFSKGISSAQAGKPVSFLEYVKGEGFVARSDLSKAHNFFPGSLPETNRTYKVARRVFSKDKTVFIGAEIHNDHQSLPFGVFVASADETGAITIASVPLPPAGIPWDVLEHAGRIYILLEHSEKNPKETSVIWSGDLEKWQELFYLKMPIFARSFAILGDFLYFSAGGEVGNPWNWQAAELSPDTGKLYRVKLPR